MTLSNEKGSILVIALIMLALLTTLGIMSTNTTTIDLQIAQNERIQRQNFNFAEAAAMEAAQRLIDESINGSNYIASAGAWVSVCDETSTAGCLFPYRTSSNWDVSGAPVVTSSVDPNAEYTVQYNGELAGASLGLGIPNIRLDKFTCYGRYSDPGRGEVMIEVALTKATS